MSVNDFRIKCRCSKKILPPTFTFSYYGCQVLCEVSGSKLVSREGGSASVEESEAVLCVPCVLAGVRYGALLVVDVSKSLHFCISFNKRSRVSTKGKPNAVVEPEYKVLSSA